MGSEEVEKTTRKDEELIFNMGLAFQQRLDKLFSLADEFAINQELIKWLNTLNVLKRNLIGNMTEDEFNTCNYYEQAFNDAYNPKPIDQKQEIISQQAFRYLSNYDAILRNLDYVLELTKPTRENAGDMNL